MELIKKLDNETSESALNVTLPMRWVETTFQGDDQIKRQLCPEFLVSDVEADHCLRYKVRPVFHEVMDVLHLCAAPMSAGGVTHIFMHPDWGTSITIQENDITYVSHSWHETREWDTFHLKVYINWLQNIIVPRQLHSLVGDWLERLRLARGTT